jgi:High-temperature-induced dauer-formation protein
MGQTASREKFRESVKALIELDVSSDDAEFWDELWKIPSSAQEVFELIPPEAARRLRDDRFENLATLFTQATAQLCQIVETPYNIYFDQALNCVRVLTRILPFLLEKGWSFIYLFVVGHVNHRSHPLDSFFVSNHFCCLWDWFCDNSFGR